MRFVAAYPPYIFSHAEFYTVASDIFGHLRGDGQLVGFFRKSARCLVFNAVTSRSFRIWQLLEVNLQEPTPSPAVRTTPRAATIAIRLLTPPSAGRAMCLSQL